MRPADISPEAWNVFINVQRRMSPGEKLQRALEWSDVLRRFAEAGLRERYPAAGEREILLRYARLTLGADLFRNAYGDALPDDEPAVLSEAIKALASALDRLWIAYAIGALQ